MFLWLFVYHVSISFPSSWHLSHYDLILWSALVPDRFCWISRAHNCVARLHYNLYNLTIINASKCVAIRAYFLRLEILGRPLAFFLFITMVTSCCFLYIPRRAIFVTVSFTVGLCVLLGDVGVCLRSHVLHLIWVEAQFEVLEIHSIE